MGRFLLTAMPFTGHVAPLCAVAGELVARGHDVRFYTGERFRARVERAGARLVPWERAPDFDENDLPATFPRLVGKKGMRQLFVNLVDCFIRTAPAQVADLTAEWEREPWDALAADETSIGAVLHSRRAARPWTTIGVLPLNMAGPSGPPSGMGLRPGTNILTRARDAVLRAAVPLIAAPLTTAIVDAERSIGLPPDRITMDRLVFSPTLIAASGSRSLDYDRDDRPAHMHWVGGLRSATPAPMQRPDWWGDLAGRTVVLVTQGTLNTDPDDLVRPAVDAFAHRDLLVVATTGIPGVDEFGFALPENARSVGFVSFDELLPLVDVAVTNGGWGGTTALLGHGIPLIIAGGDLDKPEVAARVAFSGAGVDLRTGRPSPLRIGAAFDRISADPSFRVAAERIGAELRSLGGAARVADLLERTV